MDSQQSIASKWESMLAIVNQQPEIKALTLTQQFKKLFIIRLLAENILVFLLQYSGLMFSTLCTHPSLIWFATGTSCAFIFMRGVSILPGVWLGSFIAFLLLKFTLLVSCAYASIFVLQAYALLWLHYRFISPTLIFYHATSLLLFILCSSSVTGLSSLLFAKLFYSTHPTNITHLQCWIHYWLANLNAIIILSCALITWDAYFPQIQHVKKLKKTFLYTLFITLFIATCILMLNHNLVLMSTVILLNVAIISYRYHWCGAITAIFILGFMLSLGITLDAPLFATPFSFVKLIYLQLYLLTVAVTGLLITNTCNYSDI